MKGSRAIGVVTFASILSLGTADGGQTAGQAVDGGSLGSVMALVDGPPPPVPPETISRDEQGRATVRAVR